jgi:hypothetical protein
MEALFRGAQIVREEMFLFVPPIFPGPFRANVVDQESDALIVRWVQPKPAAEDLRGLRKLA